MSKFLITFALLLGLSGVMPAQSHIDSIPRPELQGFRKNIGLNMTPLITQLVPFNRSNPRQAGPYLVHFKSYGKRNRAAFRFSMGLHLLPDNNGDVQNPQINVAMGWEKRRSLGRRWSYTRGFDFVFLAGDLGIPGTSQNDEVVVLGGGPVWGIEYFIDPRISVGTEAALILGFSPDFDFGPIPVLDILPPVGIFINHYF